MTTRENLATYSRVDLARWLLGDLRQMECNPRLVDGQMVFDEQPSPLIEVMIFNFGDELRAAIEAEAGEMNTI